MFDFDVAVIGWGKAGKTLAKKAAAAGKKVAIIEKSKAQYGGTCINVACLPTKAMIEAAHVHAKESKAEGSALFSQEAFSHAQAHRKEFVARLNNKNYHLLFDDPNVEVFDASASFVDAHTLQLTKLSGDASTITSETILINTGATARTLNVSHTKDEGAQSSRVHTSDSLLELEILPEALTIIGAGFIGLEFASMFANFGSKVTVVSPLDTLAPQLDEDVREALLAALDAQGIRFIYNAEVQGLSEHVDSVDVALNVEGKDETLSSDQVLVAIGRVPNTEGLNLEAAGVATDERGAIVVNDALQTSTDNIYAAGDVKGGPQFTFVSLDDARILMNSLQLAQNERDLTNRPVFATSTFVEPPLAQVGLSEKAASEAGLEVTVKKLPTAGIPKAHVVDELFGINKLLLDSEGYIVGASLQNPAAHEMINIVTLAINEHIPAAHLGSMIYTHPSFSEALNDLLG